MIDLQSVRFSYAPGTAPDVVNGITATIEPGEHIALLGRNGSGKSSLARLLNGLNQPTAGRVTVDGFEVADPSHLVEVRRRLQMVFQNPENQQVGFTVFDDIAFGLSNMAVPTAAMADRASEALDLVGLDVGLAREVMTLSGGELQRLALASVLALRPQYVVLDEATSMLDPLARAGFVASLARLRSHRPTGIIQITHHLEEIESADRVLVLDEGRIVAEGTPSQILARSELLARCGLEAPYRWQAAEDALPPAAIPATVLPDDSGASTDHDDDAADPGETRPGLTIDLEKVAHSYDRKNQRPRRSRLRQTRQQAPPATAAADAGHSWVLRDISATVGPGELVAITGRSGAGKSTLVSIVKGLIAPSRGSVRIDGVDPWQQRRPQDFDGIGYVFQQPEHQLFASTVRDDVAYGLKHAGLSAEEVDSRVSASLAQWGLDPSEFADRNPFELSGGQQRRVALAGVLVTGPAFLILDEPTAGLDLPSRQALFDQLHVLQESGLSVLWISHRLDEVLTHATRMLVIDGGAVVADDAPVIVLGDPGTRATLGWPLLPELDPEVRRGDLRARYLAGAASEEPAR